MRGDPLHVQVIAYLERRVTSRRDGHREKVGNGVPEKQYLGMVGRIQEDTWLLNLLGEVKRKSLDSIEDDEEESDEQREKSEHRRQSRARRT